MNARGILSGIILSLLFGCGSGSNSSVNGTIRGKSLQAADAISANGSIAQQNIGIIGISSVGGICGKVTAGQQPKNSQALLILVADVNGSQISPPAAPGTYTVVGGGQPGPKQASAAYFQYDANCQNTAGQTTTTSGTVTLTSVNNGIYVGTFDLTFNSGDHVTGSFSTSNCAPLVPFLQPQFTPTCA